jgi:hypothetical protein
MPSSDLLFFRGIAYYHGLDSRTCDQSYILCWHNKLVMIARFEYRRWYACRRLLRCKSVASQVYQAASYPRLTHVVNIRCPGIRVCQHLPLYICVYI